MYVAVYKVNKLVQISCGQIANKCLQKSIHLYNYFNKLVESFATKILKIHLFFYFTTFIVHPVIGTILPNKYTFFNFRRFNRHLIKKSQIFLNFLWSCWIIYIFKPKIIIYIFIFLNKTFTILFNLFVVFLFLFNVSILVHFSHFFSQFVLQNITVFSQNTLYMKKLQNGNKPQASSKKPSFLYFSVLDKEQNAKHLY